MAALVSVVIVTYNSASTIHDCLLSLQKQTFKSFEVILVDNVSQDDTRRVVEEAKPLLGFPLKEFYLTENLGFAGGNLRGLRDATAPFIALLNPDAFAEPAWLDELMKAMEAELDRGICASKMLCYGKDVIDSAGDGFLSWLKGFKRGEGEGSDEYSEPCSIFGACAGAALYRRTMIDSIGFLDEDYFLIHEDSDFNLRAQLAGWKAFYVPTAVVRHKVRTSIGDMSDMAIYYSLRNIEIVRLKNIPGAVLIRYSLLLCLYAMIEFLFFCLRHRKPFVYLRAKMAVIRMAPLIFRKRKAVLKLRRVSNSRLCSMFTPVFEKRSFIAKARRMFNG